MDGEIKPHDLINPTFLSSDGENLPLGPTACGPTPSSGDSPATNRRRSQAGREIESACLLPFVSLVPTTSPSNTIRRTPEDRERGHRLE